MTAVAHRLRALCRDYPRDVVQHALDAALVHCEPEASHRRDLASMLATWVSDDGDLDPPPLAHLDLGTLGAVLKARAH